MVNEIAHLSWLILPLIKETTSWLIPLFILWPLWPGSAVMTNVPRSISADSPAASFSLLPGSPVSLFWRGPSLSNSHAADVGGRGQVSSSKTVSTVIHCEDSNRQCLQVFTQTLLFISAGPHHTVSDSVYLKCNLSELEALNLSPLTQWAGHWGSKSITTYKLPCAGELGGRACRDHASLGAPTRGTVGFLSCFCLNQRHQNNLRKFKQPSIRQSFCVSPLTRLLSTDTTCILIYSHIQSRIPCSVLDTLFKNPTFSQKTLADGVKQIS